jgi:hypothetical protein
MLNISKEVRMIDCRNLVEINQDIRRTRKLLIGIGCSFVEGIGAWDQELVEELPPLKSKKNGIRPYGYDDYDIETKISISQRYKGVTILDNNIINTSDMEHANSFINVLASKYFNDEYTPVNLAIQGRGNYAAVMSLLFNSIDYHAAEEIIIIFCPTGLLRFDFVRDDCYIDRDHYVGDYFQAVWPVMYTDKEDKNNYWKFFHDGYRECIWSPRFEIINFFCATQILKQWVQLNNSKLIITPAFDQEYNKEYFQKQLFTHYSRSSNTREIVDIIDNAHSSGYNQMLDKFLWEYYFKPQGYDTFFDLALSQENNLIPEMKAWKAVNRAGKLTQFYPNGTPENWIMGCGHPGAKAHDLFAKELYNHIKAL